MSRCPPWDEATLEFQDVSSPCTDSHQHCKSTWSIFCERPVQRAGIQDCLRFTIIYWYKYYIIIGTDVVSFGVPPVCSHCPQKMPTVPRLLMLFFHMPIHIAAKHSCMPYLSSNLCSDKVSATVLCSCVLWFITSGAWPFADKLISTTNCLDDLTIFCSMFFRWFMCSVLRCFAGRGQQWAMWDLNRAVDGYRLQSSWNRTCLLHEVTTQKTGWRCNYQKQSRFPNFLKTCPTLWTD